MNIEESEISKIENFLDTKMRDELSIPLSREFTGRERLSIREIAKLSERHFKTKFSKMLVGS